MNLPLHTKVICQLVMFLERSRSSIIFPSVITNVKTERGLALQDLLIGAYEYVDTFELKPHARVYLLDYLATTEFVPLIHVRLVDLEHGLDIVFLQEQAKKSN